MDATPVQPNQTVATPDLNTLLDLVKQETLVSLNVYAIATIESFDSVKQTVSATVNYTKTVFTSNKAGVTSSKQVAYPKLVDVPVIILSGGGAALTFPIAAGDTCLILFNDRDIDNWFSTGAVKALNSARLHSLADGIALVGLRSLQNVIGGPADPIPYDSARVQLRNGRTRIAIDSKIEISNASQSLYTLLTNLLTQLQNLTTAVAAITVTASGTPTSVPINAAAIAAIGSSIGTISTNLGALLE